MKSISFVQFFSEILRELWHGSKKRCNKKTEISSLDSNLSFEFKVIKTFYQYINVLKCLNPVSIIVAARGGSYE